MIGKIVNFGIHLLIWLEDLITKVEDTEEK